MILVVAVVVNLGMGTTMEGTLSIGFDVGR